MTTDHNDIIKVVKLDCHILCSDRSLERPYLIVTSDSTTGKILDSHVRVRPNQSSDSQPDSDSKTD